MSDMERDAVMDKADMCAALAELKARFARGELDCAAIRMFRADRTWEDVVLGGDERQQAEALAELRRTFEMVRPES